MRKKTTHLIPFIPGINTATKEAFRKAFLAMLVFILPLFAFAQQQVTGKVTAQEDGSALPGVSVRIKNTNTGTATDAKGNYTITASQGSILVFSFIGYNEQEIPVTSGLRYNVSLQSVRTSLTEIIVTGQGVKREKRSLGYAVATINKEDLGDNTSPINALTGKVAGLNITSGYAPGASSRITLRGPTSFSGNNQPVFVIDGIPVSNDNIRNTDFLNDQVDYGNRGNDLNPNDIESITVLKGPAAAALYGSIASNGAILITTKKGKKNSPAQINFSTSYQLSKILKFPTFQNEFGEGNLDGIPDDRRENFSWGEKFDGKERPFGQIIDGKQQLKKYEAIPNNVKDFFDPGQTFNNNLTVSGGNEKSTYFLSVGALNNKGIIPTTNYNKYSVRVSGSSEFSDKFSSQASVGYTNISSQLPLGGQTNSVYASIFQQPRDAPIVDFKDLSNHYNGTFTGPDGTNYYGYYGAYTKNPYFLLQNYKNNNSVERVNGTFSLSYKPINGLDITERIGADIYSDRRYEKAAKYSFVPVDPFYEGNNWVDNGKYSQDITNYTQFNHDLIITYTTALTRDLNMKLLAGNNFRMTTSNNLFSATNTTGGLIVPGFYNLDNSNGPVNSTNTLSQRRLYGFYGEADFDYKNMLFLGGTIRNDVSSTLPTNNNSYVYPSVNAAFVFSELYKDKAFSDILSFGKVRVSYAKVGADAPAYRLQTTYTKTDVNGDFGEILFPITSNNATIPGFARNNRIGNPNLKPEFTSSFEVGTELSLLKNKINLDVTYYSTKSTNQIVDVPIPNSSGFNNITLNVGEMTNKGLEIGVRATPVNTAYGLRVELYGTYSKLDNKVVDINDKLDQVAISAGISGTTAMAQVAAKGRKYGTFYGTGLAVDPTSGKVIIDQATGLPLNNATNYYGSYLPDYMASFGANISYKGFMLKFLFDTKQGGVFYSNTKSLIDFGGYALETATNGRQDYVFPNSVYQDANGKYVDNTSIKFHPYDYWTNVVPAGEHIIDASYIKLREASFGYSFSQSMLRHTPFSKLTVLLYGNNLFLWVPSSNKFADPEINAQGASNVQGYEFLSNPSLRNMGIKVDVSF
ncbi:SusC/RagA family TonB-linked outer membrane protein [Chitinophaga sp. 22321]|uniref:SusC/RagA family TonB-linked outer membrane protein n=1 Tax=Chitinophaga hostae TaxID=2831022 RepID=A0ABS5IYJ2_9BACT|nr:SusC/RagA family TonB-linked outer membrane protein [Chitinophaga hostae]MBS0028038.1 SusC/RagA family TonB-linked outer membrane protein [Chitinophaga hostae]